MKPEHNQFGPSTEDSPSVVSTATISNADSPVVTWILADRPFNAVAEVIGTAPTYDTGTHAAGAAMTTIARQGSTTSGDDDKGGKGSSGKTKQSTRER
ncbi:Fc.00g092820.m01.CDS01 [Cosmosporella sp. VM-42]